MRKSSILLAALAASSFAISCGGGGGDDSPLAGNPLPLVGGLQSDADNHRLLFYLSTEESAPGLYAYDPGQPEKGGILVDGEMSPYVPHYASFFGGEFNAAGTGITDYYVSDIYYTAWGTPQGGDMMSTPIFYGEQWRVSTDPASLAAGPTRVSDTEISSSYVSAVDRFHSFDLTDPMNSSAVINGLDGWIRVRMGYDASRSPDAFGDGVEVVNPIWGQDARKNAGWLVRDSKADADGNQDVLRRVDDALDPVGPVRFEESGEVVQGVKAAKYINDQGDGTVLLALGIGQSDWGDTYLYESVDAPGDGGTIRPLYNAEGQRLVVSFAPMGMDDSSVSVSPPAPNLTALMPSGFYFAAGPSMFDQVWTALYRLDSEGWAAFDHKEHVSNAGDMGSPLLASRLAGFVIQVGPDKLFWSLAGVNEVVDVSSRDPNEWTRTKVTAAGGEAEGTPVLASADGWVYYNTHDDEAVLLNVDSGESVALKNAKWLGASTTTRIEMVNSRQVSRPISEVFFVQNGRRLGAVSAADPMAGMVSLGDLGPDVEEVRLFGAASGPHRLARVEYEDDSFEVVYMNTRESDSLKSLMPARATDWKMPYSFTIQGGEEQHGEFEIMGENTRPFNGF